MPAKAAAYERETHFREGLATAQEVLGDRLSDVLHRSALLMVKPDGLVTARLGTVLGFLGEHGFSVAAVREVRLVPLLWREMWRYQLTSATLDRLALNDHVYAVGPALVLGLRDERPSASPAAVRLSGLKGSSDPARRGPDSLRSRLGDPTRILSHIHVADEPADVVRELGLLLGPQDRASFHAALGGEGMPAADRALLDAAVAGESAGRSTDPSGPLDELELSLAEVGAEDPETLVRLKRASDALAAIRARQTIRWRQFVADLGALGLRVDDWDLAVLGSICVPCDEPGHPKSIDNPEPGIWEREYVRVES